MKQRLGETKIFLIKKWYHWDLKPFSVWKKPFLIGGCKFKSAELYCHSISFDLRGTWAGKISSWPSLPAYMALQPYSRATSSCAHICQGLCDRASFRYITPLAIFLMIYRIMQPSCSCNSAYYTIAFSIPICIATSTRPVLADCCCSSPVFAAWQTEEQQLSPALKEITGFLQLQVCSDDSYSPCTCLIKWYIDTYISYL